MKILKLKSILFGLIAVFAVTALLTSCEQDALDIPDTVESDVNELSFKHNRDIEILSENGRSKATITASTNDVSLLNEIKQGDFKIIPIFEQPAEDLNQFTDDGTSNISEDAESFTGGVSMGISVKNVELEEGAIGYSIDVKETISSRSSGSKMFWSSANNVVIERFFGCVRAEIWQKKSWNTGYSYKKNDNKCNRKCTIYCGGSSDQLQVKMSGSAAYRITFGNDCGKLYRQGC